MVDRRTVMAGGTALLAAPALGQTKGASQMYGLIGQMKAQPGKRAELAAILLGATRDMPGNRSYVIAEDLADADALWITEVWDSREAHAASLQLPQVQAAIAKARPLLAGFGQRFETVPLNNADELE